MHPWGSHLDIFFTLVGSLLNRFLVIFFILFASSVALANNEPTPVSQNPLEAISPPKLNAKYFPLDTNGTTLTSSANCHLILGGGTELYGARLHGDYSIQQDGYGIILDIKSGQQVRLDHHFQKYGYVMGFDPQGQWILLRQPAGSGVRFNSLVRFNLKTFEKEYLMADPRINFEIAGETLSKSGRFALIAEAYRQNQLLLHRWDLHRDTMAQTFVVDSPQADNSHARNLLISEDGNTFAALGAVNKIKGSTGGTTRVWRIAKNGGQPLIYNLPGAPKFISPDGSLVLTKEFHGTFRLFRFQKRSFVEMNLNGQAEVFEKLGLLNEHILTRTSEHVRFISAQLGSDGRLAIELSYEVHNGIIEKGDQWTKHSFSRHEAILVWDLLRPSQKPFFIDKSIENKFHKQAYRLLPGGRMFLVGANNVEMVFLDPISQDELHLPLYKLLSPDDEYIWRIEFSDDLTKVALSTNQGVLVLDLSNLVK